MSISSTRAFASREGCTLPKLFEREKTDQDDRMIFADTAVEASGWYDRDTNMLKVERRLVEEGFNVHQASAISTCALRIHLGTCTVADLVEFTGTIQDETIVQIR